MKNKIIFTKTVDSISDDYFPKKTSDFLPDWYKKTSTYVNEKKDVDIVNASTNGTIKKCMPVFDALTAGYTIPTYCDLWVRKNEIGEQIYITSSDLNIEFHSIIQAPYHPSMNSQPYPKWINPWAIKTPPGYSSLFIPPVHQSNNFFQIIEGFVDTDTYSAPVNFPFLINDINFEGLIPAGTPMVQVIPIKRENWKIEKGNNKDIKEIMNVQKKLNSQFFDRYKKMFWHKKEYL
jgi:hypothetical protein